MEINKLIKKYIILLLIYLALYNFLHPFIFELYMTVFEPSLSNPLLTEKIKFANNLSGFLINIFFFIFLLIDIKPKKLIDWLIISITLFVAGYGIILYIIWKIHEENQNVLAQRKDE